MEKSTNVESGYEESTEQLRKIFESQLFLAKRLVKNDLPERAHEARILLASICSTGGAIAKLGQDPEYFFTEITMLARAFIEKTVNFCYLNLCSEDEYKKFFSHAYYRAYHNSDREKYAGEKKIGIKFSGRDELKNNPKIAAALSDFSDTNPRLKWSPLSIDEKVSFIGENSSVKIEFFLMNTLTIYSDASESLHGSLYGCTYHLGAFEPGSDRNDTVAITNSVYKKSALLFAQLSSMIAETIRFICDEEKHKDTIESSKELEGNTLSLMKKIFGSNGDANV